MPNAGHSNWGFGRRAYCAQHFVDNKTIKRQLKKKYIYIYKREHASHCLPNELEYEMEMEMAMEMANGSNAAQTTFCMHASQPAS